MSKRKKQRQATWQRVLQRNIGWVIAGAVAVIAVLVIGVLVLSGGSSSDSTSGSVATPTPDSRVAGQTPAATVSVQTNDDGQNVNPRFEPRSIEGNAGKVAEIVVKNAGSVAHNLRVAGVDKQYDTADDFASATVQPGTERRLLVRIDAPGSYEFRCDFHPDQQTGTLVLK